jgi:hypothetical protein
MRENRIKEFIFTPLTNSAAATSSTEYTDHVINGEILEVSWKYGTQGATGSIALTFSGTQEVFCSNIALSGTKTMVVRPYVLPQASTGSASDAMLVPYVCNDKVLLTTTALLSGTTPFTCSFKYR